MSPKRSRALILFQDRYFSKSQFIEKVMEKKVFRSKKSAYLCLTHFIENGFIKSSSIYGKGILTLTDKGSLYIDVLKDIIRSEERC